MSVPAPLLRDVARALAAETGLSLTDGLERKLADGLEAAAEAFGEPAGELARRVLAHDRAAVSALVEHAVVSETAFWRHPGQLLALGAALAAAPEPLRIWSAGCASGEEPYSVAIALLEHGRAARGDRILGTDVSGRALDAARAGTYGGRALRKLPPHLAARYFEGDRVRSVRAEVRAAVELARHNLVADPAPGGPFDAVLCRNVLIYFEPTTAAEVLYRLVAALRPGGLLVLGPVELSLAAPLALEWIEEGDATLLRRPG